MYKKEANCRDVLFVRYEKLVAADAIVIDELNSFCELQSPITQDRIKAFPIFGSSKDRGKNAELHWEQVERSKEFQPVGRSKNWGLYKKHIFSKVCQDANRFLKEINI